MHGKSCIQLSRELMPPFSVYCLSSMPLVLDRIEQEMDLTDSRFFLSPEQEAAIVLQAGDPNVMFRLTMAIVFVHVMKHSSSVGNVYSVFLEMPAYSVHTWQAYVARFVMTFAFRLSKQSAFAISSFFYSLGADSITSVTGVFPTMRNAINHSITGARKRLKASL